MNDIYILPNKRKIIIMQQIIKQIKSKLIIIQSYMSILTDNFINFIKNLICTKENTSHQSVINSTSPQVTNNNEIHDLTDNDIDSFVIIDVNNKINKNTILNKINQNILGQIYAKQEYAYRIDKMGIENIECYICFEENMKMVALECTHSICHNCYNKLIKNKYFDCPVCDKKMKHITVYKFYAVILPYDHNAICILYLPLIYDEKKNIWLEYEVFHNIANDHNQKSKFISSCHRINIENYAVIVLDPKLKIFIKSIHSIHTQRIIYDNNIS